MNASMKYVMRSDTKIVSGIFSVFEGSMTGWSVTISTTPQRRPAARAKSPSTGLIRERTIAMTPVIEQAKLFKAARESAVIKEISFFMIRFARKSITARITVKRSVRKNIPKNIPA